LFAPPAAAEFLAPQSISVYLDGRTHELRYEAGDTVLATVQRSGLEPPFSCTEGFCGCCMAKLRTGQVRMIRNDFLSERELEEGWVLTCQSIPVTAECAVEYPD
jgi:3-ketosteroid 9alpha-monooxygenase subunit B